MSRKLEYGALTQLLVTATAIIFWLHMLICLAKETWRASIWRLCAQHQLWLLLWHSMGQPGSTERKHLWLQSSKTFSKISLTVGYTWCSSHVLFYFLWSFFNVVQHGIIEKGTLNASPAPAGQQSRALLLCRGPNLVCLSVAQRIHLQLCWVERKIRTSDFLLGLFASINPFTIVPSSFLNYTVAFIFHGSFYKTRSAIGSY